MAKKIILACEQCGSRNYTTNAAQSQTERLELKKFCKACGAQTTHRQTK